jgi:hypothetical protein
MGSPQGDCLSPILFTLYLAMALRDDTPDTEVKTVNEKDHTYGYTNHDTGTTPTSHDHSYSSYHHTNKVKKERDTQIDNIELQYADDINYLAQNYTTIEYHKQKIPGKLEKRKLECNHSKDEEFKITRKYNSAECINCKDCKRCGECKKCKE